MWRACAECSTLKKNTHTQFAISLATKRRKRREEDDDAFGNILCFFCFFLYVGKSESIPLASKSKSMLTGERYVVFGLENGNTARWQCLLIRKRMSFGPDLWQTRHKE